jgi:hypothetical protein
MRLVFTCFSALGCYGSTFCAASTWSAFIAPVGIGRLGCRIAVIGDALPAIGILAPLYRLVSVDRWCCVGFHRGLPRGLAALNRLLIPGGHGYTFFVGVFRGVFLFSLFFVSAPTWVIAGDPIVCDLALEIPTSVWGVGLAYLHLGYLRGIGMHFSLAGAPVGDRMCG